MLAERMSRTFCAGGKLPAREGQGVVASALLEAREAGSGPVLFWRRCQLFGLLLWRLGQGSWLARVQRQCQRAELACKGVYTTVNSA